MPDGVALVIVSEVVRLGNLLWVKLPAELNDVDRGLERAIEGPPDTAGLGADSGLMSRPFGSSCHCRSSYEGNDDGLDNAELL
jgi:hypothetical protein